MTTDAALQIRPLGPADLNQLAELEVRAYPSPWTRRMFEGEFAREYTCHVGAFTEDRLSGYAIVSRLGDEWHIMNLAVDPDMRRQGIARTLLDDVLQRVGHEHVTLEVRVSNEAALGLYRNEGFEVRGTRPRYYADTGEDAHVMWRDPT
jgi:ribosomal-protein-alanine N-acetyltransferase